MSDSQPEAPADDPRVRLAAERTLLAWIRTGLAMMGLGFVVARFGLFLRELAGAEEIPVPQTGMSLWTGTALLVLGVLVTLVAAVQHYRFVDRLDRGLPWRPARWSLGIIVAIVMSVVGVGLAVYLHRIPA